MGGGSSKDAVIDALGELIAAANVIPYASAKDEPSAASSASVWSKLFERALSLDDLYELVQPDDVRRIMRQTPENFRSLLHKLVERVTLSAIRGCNTTEMATGAINGIRFLTRIMPLVFEDQEWREYMWKVGREPPTTFPTSPATGITLAGILVEALTDLCFSPGFTIATTLTVAELDSREFIWETGIGMEAAKPSAHLDGNREEVLRLLITLCMSSALYQPPGHISNPWLATLTSGKVRHTLPLICSCLNVVCSYDPVGYGIPYNFLLVSDKRAPLVVMAAQLLILCLDYPGDQQVASAESEFGNEVPRTPTSPHLPAASLGNSWATSLSRLHRLEDFTFVLRGLSRLLQNTLRSTYLPGSQVKIDFQQEVLVILWKMCDLNKHFLHHLLKSSDVLELVVPILSFCLEARNDQSPRVGLVHICAFLLLLFSGERNFGVRLNKAWTGHAFADIPAFVGSYADLMILTFHRTITMGHERLSSLQDCFLTILANVSPYFKSITLVSSAKLLHLFEFYSTPRFLLARPNNHNLLVFLIEIFNNVIQYQFDGNANMIYTIICKRAAFDHLSSLTLDKCQASIAAKSASATPVAYETEAFEATQEWFDEWKSHLQLQTINRMLQILGPQVEKICVDRGVTDEAEILDFLRHGTLVGLLPVPHPILIRKYQPNAGTASWLTTYIHGLLYLRLANVWSGVAVVLFQAAAAKAASSSSRPPSSNAATPDGE
ncbi:hypothetical protein CAOG_03930 [Capsaspora owczarzaki ATCC 30864]|uniref:HID1 domain-containing protein n=1 Tax=Capsaspora owczarzaki (strain ATCC 30864) TaxID=595528 RepID=A0A0D2VQT5_CAPO3|nr:hypothetical protein CAOG_03930 [Capsaspora owczarzaki ATCC 30864]KJE93087.1 hypothetical protein CAOG_003930 [Capsaspora owczarzaki ATCC 30864]|eukprot:XP_004363658.1 hypothetical protein CAOG_03930 [Capsaspora owczarzaki ATCC 30864]